MRISKICLRDISSSASFLLWQFERELQWSQMARIIVIIFLVLMMQLVTSGIIPMDDEQQGNLFVQVEFVFHPLH